MGPAIAGSLVGATDGTLRRVVVSLDETESIRESPLAARPLAERLQVFLQLETTMVEVGEGRVAVAIRFGEMDPDVLAQRSRSEGVPDVGNHAITIEGR